MSSVVVEDFSYQYDQGNNALSGINLSIAAGEKVCIAGPNGAGKSTLLHSLAGLIHGRGRITVAGASLHKDDKQHGPELSRLGLVFQNPDDQLFCTTVGEDVAFGPRNQKLSKDIVAERVAQSLDLVGLRGFEDRHPHHLSLGEKKRAAIAAVLACRPEILALDEPWANLDAHASRSVSSILKNFPGTVIVISQELYHATSVCERMILLDRGQIIADGELRKLLAQADIREYFSLNNQDICPVCQSRIE